MMQQQFNHDVFAAEQDLAAEARGGVNTTRVEALRLKMQRWQLSPTRARLGFAAYPNLNPNLHPSPNPNLNQVADHLRAPTGRATIRSGHGCIAGVPTALPPALPLPYPNTSRNQPFQVYQRLVAQLGNAVDEWAAAADVEQGAQAALHVVQQVDH